MANDIAHQHASERSAGKPRSEIAYLVGVREQHIRRVMETDQLFQRDRVSIGGVFAQQGVVYRMNPVELKSGPAMPSTG